ncbi:hypothetical protein [Thaumasiovibrio sp. DFM-14]|uniref:hypothetical protein n=1 Tax=Thaumasiovibrio sp. DFM-14 TaxID=3384792 RepID=UPI0039A061FE
MAIEICKNFLCVKSDSLDLKYSFDLVYFEGVAGLKGFNGNVSCKEFLEELMLASYYYDGSGFCQVNEDTCKNTKFISKVYGKQGVFYHFPSSDFRLFTSQVNEINREIKLLTLKKKLKKGTEISIPEEIDAGKYKSNMLGSLISYFIQCKFVTVWPGYWGEYGLHFLVTSGALDCEVESYNRRALSMQ